MFDKLKLWANDLIYENKGGHSQNVLSSFYISVKPGNSYKRGRLSTVDLLVATNLDKLILY